MIENIFAYMKTALEQTFSPMGIELKHKSETKISDWLEK